MLTGCVISGDVEVMENHVNDGIGKSDVELAAKSATVSI